MNWLRRITLLQWALGISLAIHGSLLMLKIAAPDQFDRIFQDSPLDVILVNTRAKDEEPDKAQALAQTQLAGGGELKTGFTASPLPSSATTDAGDSADTMQRQIAAMQKQQSVLLAQVKQLLAQLPPPQPQNVNESQAQIEQKRRQLLKLLGSIEERINQENTRPRRHYISPATREVAYAMYYDALRRKVESRGTQYFPEASGQKLYGELTMIITVSSNGQVVSTEIVQSSGQADLDRRAEAIAAAAGPYGEFTPDMRRQADQLVVVSRFVFSRDNALHTGAAGEDPR